MGARFEFAGDLYVKTGPLVASQERSGQQKFMARYAVVRPIAETRPKASEAPVPELKHASAILQSFYGRCVAILEDMASAVPTEQLEAAKRQLSHEWLAAEHALRDASSSRTGQ